MARSIYHSGFLLKLTVFRFKANKLPVNVKLIHKDLRFFFLHENRIEIPLCYKYACIQSSWTVLYFYLGIEHFPFHTPIFPFFHRSMVWSASLGFLLLRRVPLHTHPSAYQPCCRTWFLLALSSLTSRLEFDGSVLNAAPTHSICCFLFTDVPAYCSCCLK